MKIHGKITPSNRAEVLKLAKWARLSTEANETVPTDKTRPVKVSSANLSGTFVKAESTDLAVCTEYSEGFYDNTEVPVFHATIVYVTGVNIG